jgi:thiamine pyrophosphokinase
MNYPTILPNGSFDAVVLANGEQPQHPIPLQLLQEAPFLVCCDGAIQQCKKANVIVGDGDSIPAWAREQYQHCLHLESEQDDNDLTKATRFCVAKGLKRIVYLGATGLREDHTLGNISLIMRYAREMGVEPVMATNHGWFVPAKGTATFESFPRQQVSLFNFGCTSLRTEGLRYDGYPFDQWWQGTLNEAIGPHFRIEADGFYLVFRTYEAK